MNQKVNNQKWYYQKESNCPYLTLFHLRISLF